MIERYKGENPENVVGLEEHKKRPFYKKVSFWVLSALGLFFASCSIYGLVLGSQYVRAVTEAAHLIADGNSVEEEDTLKASPRAIGGRHDSIAIDWSPSSPGYYALDGSAIQWGASAPFWNFQWDKNLSAYTLQLSWAGYYYISIPDYIPNFSWVTHQGQEEMGFRFDAEYSNGIGRMISLGTGFPMRVTGTFYFDPYRSGYQAGYSSGYDNGYSEAQNGTTVHLSVAPEYYPQTGTFHYEWHVDGEVQQAGELAYQGSNGWQSVDLYRNPGSTARLVFNRPGTRFFAEYSITPFGNDGGYPTLNDTNAYDFDDAIWYAPSYYEEFYIRAQGGSASSDHNSDSYDLYFDPEHNERAHIGLWDEGYKQGYSEGMEDNGRWQQGWNTGYKTGKDEGYTNGYQKGVSDTQSGSKALMNMFVTAFQQPFNQVYRFLNFNLLGINVLSLFTALLTLSVGIIIIKKVL